MAKFCTKSPSELLDYQNDWSDWLDTDEISASEWTVPSGLTRTGDTNTTTTTIVWLSGGTDGQAYVVSNTITTTGGRTAERVVVILVIERSLEETALITVAEYRAFTNDDLGDLPVAYVDNILKAVSDDIENWCGRSLGVQTVTNEATQGRAILYNRQPVLRITVKETPIAAVTALALWYAVDSDPTSLSVDDAVIEAGGAAFLVPFGAFGLWQTFFQVGNVYRARASYTGGEVVSHVVKRAVALLAQEALALDSAASYQDTDDYDSFSIGSYSEKKAARDLSASGGLGLGTKNSISAANLLRKYKSGGVMFL